MNENRIATEVELLQSMYPDRIRYNDKAQELQYTTPQGKLELRLPPGYLTANALPEVLSATIARTDRRDEIGSFIKEKCSGGEEVLDSIVAEFDELSEREETRQQSGKTANEATSSGEGDAMTDHAEKATVIVWLHHLLNTNKRKQALSPPSSLVLGITKPGYPGVLIYSGPKKEVYEHVNELKALNWQAFQVRYEDEEEWVFEHGRGVREVESMGDVVGGIGEGKKEIFMEAMRMR